MMTATPDAFTDAERGGLYRALRERRDVRSPFLPDPVPPDVPVRRQVHALFERENQKALANDAGDQAALDKRLKLEGILDSPLNLCISCDRSRGGPHVLGRNPVLRMLHGLGPATWQRIIPLSGRVNCHR